MSYKNALISLLMISIVGFATWATLSFYRPSTIIAEPGAELPDAYMEDVIALVMDQSGNPSLKLKTPLMVHYSQYNTAHLTTPEVILYRQSTQPWFINARYGKSTRGIEQVDFWENVTLFRPMDQRNPETWIKTETLTIHPNQKTAATNDTITLTQNNLLLEAIGMEANMKNGDIKLLSHARGEYVPGV